MFKPQTTIRKRVLQEVDKRIADAQSKYDAKVTELEAELEAKKSAYADELVASVLGTPSSPTQP